MSKLDREREREAERNKKRKFKWIQTQAWKLNEKFYEKQWGKSLIEKWGQKNGRKFQDKSKINLKTRIGES